MVLKTIRLCLDMRRASKALIRKTDNSEIRRDTALVTQCNTFFKNRSQRKLSLDLIRWRVSFVTIKLCTNQRDYYMDQFLPLRALKKS